jgi:hypothetical protein
LYSQKKETKEKATLSHLFPALLSFMDDNRNSPRNKPNKAWLVARFKQSIAGNFHETSATQRGCKG